MNQTLLSFLSDEQGSSSWKYHLVTCHSEELVMKVFYWNCQSTIKKIYCNTVVQLFFHIISRSGLPRTLYPSFTNLLWKLQLDMHNPYVYAVLVTVIDLSLNFHFPSNCCRLQVNNFLNLKLDSSDLKLEQFKLVLQGVRIEFQSQDCQLNTLQQYSIL